MPAALASAAMSEVECALKLWGDSLCTGLAWATEADCGRAI